MALKLLHLPHPYKVVDLIDERPKGAFHDFFKKIICTFFSYNVALF